MTEYLVDAYAVYECLYTDIHTHALIQTICMLTDAWRNGVAKSIM